MYRGRKSIRRGGTSKQLRTNNETRNKPITRTQSKLCEEGQVDEHDDNFVLIQLTSNKKLLVSSFIDLLQLNKKEKIKIGSDILFKMDNQQSTHATVFFISSKEQCLEEANIINIQRDNKKISNIGVTIDDGDAPSLVITTTSTKPTQKISTEFRNTNNPEVINSGISIDSIEADLNLFSSSCTSSSSTTEPTPSHLMLINRNQNATLGAFSLTSSIDIITTSSKPPPTSSIDITTTSPETPPASSIDIITTLPKSPPTLSINRNVVKTTSNLQRDRMDPMSHLTVELKKVTEDRDKWRNKCKSLEKRYLELENASMMIPTDDNVCEWICTMYDAIQRQTNSDINFDAESKKLGISSDLLKFCVNRNKTPTAMARQIFQYMCLEELSEGTTWSNIPINKIDALHAFGEKVFGCLKWDRKIIKVSLQNFIRSERFNLKRDQRQERQDLGHNDPVVDEVAAEHIE